MIINQINNSCQFKTNSFKAYKKSVYDKVTNRFLYDTTTCFARRDLDWNKLTDFLINKYKNVSKVNTIIHACSDGEELYTFAAALLSRGINTDKFFPIIGKDINKDNIKIAQNSIYEISNKEIEQLENIIKTSYRNYFDILPDTSFNSKDTVKIKGKDTFSKLLKFEQGDITEDYRSIPSENTILFLRNVWPYLGTKNGYKLSAKLVYQLKPSSTLVIGMYDRAWNFCKILKDAGFKETEVPYVFEPQ